MNAQKSVTRTQRTISPATPNSYYDICRGIHVTIPPMIPDIIIARRDGAWCYALGSHYTSTGFHDYEDPAIVAKFINSKTAGPINVIVDFGS